MYNALRMKKITFRILTITAFLLAVHGLCSANTKAIEGILAGTGPGKVWMNKGAADGVIEDMIFDVIRGGEVIGKIKIKKAGQTSSEAVPVEMKDGVAFSAGDAVKFSGAMDSGVKKEQPPAGVTAPDVKDEKNTETPAEQKPEENKTPPADTVTAAIPVTPEPEKIAETDKTAKNIETMKTETPPETKKEKEKVKNTNSAGKWGLKNKSTRMIISAVIALLIFGRRF